VVVARSRREELGVGVLILGALAVLVWMAVRIGALSGFADTVDVRLRLGDAAGLQAGSVVSVAGVPVGRVESLGVEQGRAVAVLALQPGAGVRRDVDARVRARSLLGEKYVQLTPRSAGAALLVDGDAIDVSGEQVEVDEVLSALAPVLRAVDPEALAKALAAVAEAVAEDPARVSRMLADAEILLDSGAATAERLPGLVDRVQGTLGRVDRAADSASARLAEARAPVDRADRLLAEAEAAGVGEAVREARAALVEVRDVASDAGDLLGDLDGLDGDLRRVLANLAEIDKWEMRRLLREEGILIRIREREVVPAPRSPD
jgi:phospholipid/cholesterol/gamma-HCH transport system substrate-binding protein